MIKRTKNISINIMSALIILITILLACVSSTNSWFTQTKEHGVRVDLVVADLNLQVYQLIDSNETKIYATQKTNDYGSENQTSGVPQYLVLKDEIRPDEFVPITLTLKNEDAGSSSLYVRFKMELYRRTLNGDVLVPIEVVPGGIAENKTSGFGVKDGDDSGYCYYQNGSQENTLFATGESAVMLTKFKVPYTSFIDASGDMLIKNSETCYMKIVVEASLNDSFNNL